MSAALFPFGQGCTSSYRRAVEINPFREIMPRNLCKVHHSLTAIRRTLRLKPSHSSLYAPTHVANMVCGRKSSTKFLHVFSKRIHPKRNWLATGVRKIWTWFIVRVSGWTKHVYRYIGKYAKLLSYAVTSEAWTGHFRWWRKQLSLQPGQQSLTHMFKSKMPMNKSTKHV